MVKQPEFTAEVRDLIEAVLRLFATTAQLPIAIYRCGPDNLPSDVISNEGQLALPSTSDPNDSLFQRVELRSPATRDGEISLLIQYGTPNPENQNGRASLEATKTLLPRILKGVAHEYAYFMQHEMKLQRTAYHDIQIRLQAALAHGENLQASLEKDSPEHGSAESLLGAISAAATVIHNLTRGESLPQRYMLRVCDLRKIIDRLASFFGAEAEAKGVRIATDFRPPHFVVQASELHIEQALSNLLHNAVKYSYRGSNDLERFVSVQGRILSADCEVTISNYGVGIESDENDKIFMSGYQGRLTDLEYRTGSGQGLSLAKEIIERHHGTITVSSRPMSERTSDGQFPYLTRFTMRLPIKQPRF